VRRKSACGCGDTGSRMKMCDPQIENLVLPRPEQLAADASVEPGYSRRNTL
jgi:hypothetical protein